MTSNLLNLVKGGFIFKTLNFDAVGSFKIEISFPICLTMFKSSIKREMNAIGIYGNCNVQGCPKKNLIRKQVKIISINKGCRSKSVDFHIFASI